MASDNALLTASPDALEAWLAAVRARDNALAPPPVDYTGWDKPNPNQGWMTLHRANQTPATARDAAIDAAVQNALAPAANTTYGDVLPMARDNATGELRIALPAGLRSLAQGAWDVSQGPRTGSVTPEGTLALASLVNPLERPQEGVLHSFAGSKRALRELEAAGKAEGQTLLDKTIARTEGRDTVPVPLSEVVAKAAAEDAARAAPMADTPILRGIREESRVSTRAGEPPKAKPGEPAPVDPHTVATSNVSLDAMKAGDSYPKNAMLLRDGDFPDLPVKGLRSPDSIVHKSIQHMVDNLLFLHDEYKGKFGQETIDKAARWYDGAHKIALRIAEETGYTPEQVAGVMANLSPQKDWYQNADLADRMIDIIRNGGGAKFSPEMRAWGNKFSEETQASIAKDTAKLGHTPETFMAHILELKRAGAEIPVEYRKTLARQNRLDELRTSMAALSRPGVTLNQINDPDARALFVRAYDEAHHKKDYPILTPEGDAGEMATNKDGSPRQAGWGSFVEIKKALAVLSNSDLKLISKSLGDNHKVRSFYNNIISPNSEWDDTTIDTHAINATHLRPMGGSHPVVNFGLGTGGSSSKSTGAKGGYAIHHEAYRQAAEKLGLLPRQLQSIAWEAVRGLFSPEQKRDKAFVAENERIWSQFRAGKITAAQARSLILAHAKGIDPPTWYVPPPAPEKEP